MQFKAIYVLVGLCYASAWASPAPLQKRATSITINGYEEAGCPAPGGQNGFLGHVTFTGTGTVQGCGIFEGKDGNPMNSYQVTADSSQCTRTLFSGDNCDGESFGPSFQDSDNNCESAILTLSDGTITGARSIFVTCS